MEQLVQALLWWTRRMQGLLFALMVMNLSCNLLHNRCLALMIITPDHIAGNRAEQWLKIVAPCGV